jgi:ubiquinone/menaquinone biosynthesis C-methylase UbiE
MKETMGHTLRPGGFNLTEKGVRFCNISTAHRVLDLGCGRGATVVYLKERHHIQAVGIDPSEKLIEAARKLCEGLEFVIGRGEDIPFDDRNFQCVFAECTLSLMDDVDSAIKEVYRVLEDKGWFIITDVYAKHSDNIEELNQFSLNSCMRGLHDLGVLIEKLEGSGFEIHLLEDHSDLLKQLMVEIGFSYGSMDVFWNITTQNCIDGCKFQQALKRCKPGYFMLVARKGGVNRG